MRREIFLVRPAKHIDEIKGLNFFDRRKKGLKLAKKIMTKCPITVRQENSRNLLITEVILPIITNMDVTLSEGYIRGIIDRFNDWCKNNIHGNIILDDFFIKYKEDFVNTVVETKYLNILYIRNIIESLKKSENIKGDEASVAIICDQIDIMRYVVTSLIESLHYFRVITTKEQDCAGFALDIYNKYGVLIDFTHYEDVDQIEEDIVIDCRKVVKKEFYKVKEDSLVLYGVLDDCSVLMNANKRTDVDFVFELDVTCPNFINNKVFLWTLMSENREISRLLSRFTTDDTFESTREYLETFEVSVSYTIV